MHKCLPLAVFTLSFSQGFCEDNIFDQSVSHTVKIYEHHILKHLVLKSEYCEKEEYRLLTIYNLRVKQTECEASKTRIFGKSHWNEIYLYLTDCLVSRDYGNVVIDEAPQDHENPG